MQFDFTLHKPVDIFTKEHCVRENGARLAALGTKAYLVKGRHGADACGAAADVLAVLDEHHIPCVRMNRVPENPPAPLCHEAGSECREAGCDFVIAIGGGSALDAAKAIAAYAANPTADVMDIFDPAKLPCDGLPLAAIPTTAGTGSEACYASVLTIDGGKKKKSFKTASSCPKVSFLDPRYTYTLTNDYTISTALDALAHCIESYLSPKATEMSRKAAVYGASEVWAVLFRGEDGDGEKDSGGFTEKQRARLLYAASAGGIAISYTGTGFPHPLGYGITLEYGVPHGRACAAFEGMFIRSNMTTAEGKEKLEALAAALGTTVQEMELRIPEMGAVKLEMTEEKIEELVSRVDGAKNYENSPYVLSPEARRMIYKVLFLKN